MAVLFISIDQMPVLAPTFDNADWHFALVIRPGVYLQAAARRGGGSRPSQW